MDKINFAIVYLFIIMFLSSSFSQVKKGLKEIDISGNISGSSSDEKKINPTNGLFVYEEEITVFQLNLTYGHLLTNNFEVGGKVSMLKVDKFDATGNLSVFVSYYLNGGNDQSKIFPYIGIDAGMGFLNDYTDTYNYGIFIGAKFFFSESSAISAQPFYFKQSSTYEDRIFYGVLLGISNFF